MLNISKIPLNDLSLSAQIMLIDPTYLQHKSNPNLSRLELYKENKDAINGTLQFVTNIDIEDGTHDLQLSDGKTVSLTVDSGEIVAFLNFDLKRLDLQPKPNLKRNVNYVILSAEEYAKVFNE